MVHGPDTIEVFTSVTTRNTLILTVKYFSH